MTAINIEQYMTQLLHAEKCMIAELRRLHDEGYKEIAPGVLQSPDGSTIVEF